MHTGAYAGPRMKTEAAQHTGTPTASPRFLTTEELALLLNVDPSTPYRWRRNGVGPRWLKLGDGRQQAIRYRIEDVDAWLSECAQGGGA